MPAPGGGWMPGPLSSTTRPKPVYTGMFRSPGRGLVAPGTIPGSVPLGFNPDESYADAMSRNQARIAAESPLAEIDAITNQAVQAALTTPSPPPAPRFSIKDSVPKNTAAALERDQRVTPLIQANATAEALGAPGIESPVWQGPRLSRNESLPSATQAIALARRQAEVNDYDSYTLGQKIQTSSGEFTVQQLIEAGSESDARKAKWRADAEVRQQESLNNALTSPVSISGTYAPTGWPVVPAAVPKALPDPSVFGGVFNTNKPGGLFGTGKGNETVFGGLFSTKRRK